MYLNSSLDTSRQKLETYYLLNRSLNTSQSIKHHGSAKINNTKKPITYSFEAQIEIRLNWYLKDIISHLLGGFLERETVTSQPNYIINFMGLYTQYYLNYSKCIKLGYCDIIKHICSFNVVERSFIKIRIYVHSCFIIWAFLEYRTMEW